MGKPVTGQGGTPGWLAFALLTGLFWACLTQNAGAQGPPAPAIQHDEILPAAASGACGGRGGDPQVASTQDDIRFAFPLYRSSTVIVGNSFGWSHVRLGYTGFDPCFAPLRVADLWAISYNVFLRIAGDDDSAWQIYLAGQRSAEGYPTDPSTVRYSGGVVHTFKSSPETTWGIGAYLTYVLGSPRVLPGLSYSHRADPWQVDIRAPFVANVWYRTSELLRFGVQTQLSGGQFDLDRTDPAATTFQYANATAGIALGVGRKTGPQMELGAGYTIYRIYQIIDDGRNVETLTLENRPYGRVRLVMQF